MFNKFWVHAWSRCGGLNQRWTGVKVNAQVIIFNINNNIKEPTTLNIVFSVAYYFGITQC